MRILPLTPTSLTSAKTKPSRSILGSAYTRVPSLLEIDPRMGGVGEQTDIRHVQTNVAKIVRYIHIGLDVEFRMEVVLQYAYKTTRNVVKNTCSNLIGTVYGPDAANPSSCAESAENKLRVFNTDLGLLLRHLEAIKLH
jgi:hypothetical protein